MYQQYKLNRQEDQVPCVEALSTSGRRTGYSTDVILHPMKSEVYWSVEYHCLSTVLGVSAILHDSGEDTERLDARRWCGLTRWSGERGSGPRHNCLPD